MNQSTISNKLSFKLNQLEEEGSVLDSLIAQADALLNSNTVTSAEIGAFRQKITEYVTAYRVKFIEC